jgi:hypothetical protein
VISNGEGVTLNNSTALTTVLTIIRNSGTAVIPSKTLKPTATATEYSTPKNSGSSVGL